MSTRRVVVTGANKGIGRAIATEALRHADDVMIYLGSRDEDRGRAAIDAIVSENPDFADRLRLLPINVSKSDSVANAAKLVAADWPDEPHPLYAVVNNAGLRYDSLRSVLEVNTVGMHRVSATFIPLLSPDTGRIVNITSAAGPSFVAACSPERQSLFLKKRVEWSQIRELMDESLALEGKEEFEAAGLSDGAPYGLSKACSNSLTLYLARKHPALRINACTPGFIETDITRPQAAAEGMSPSEMGMKPPVDGTRAPLFLLFGEPEGSGRYYGSDCERSPLDRYRSPGDPPYTGE